jgi:hypothetical protein
MDKRMKMNECIYCKNTFSTKTALVRHLKSSVKCIKTRSGTTDVDELTCECGYTTSRRDHLLQHIAICKVSDRIKKYTKTIEDQANIIEDHVKTIEDHVKTIANDCKTIAELKEQVKLLMTRPINPTSTVVDPESQKPPVKQLSLNSCTIVMREEDGYINVSELCKAGGKAFKHWNVNDRSKAFLTVLKRSVGIPTDLLISSIMTGPNETRGTWAHPQVAINIAQWISPEFDVQVSKWVYELTFTGSVTLGKEKSEEAIQKAFREMIAIDLRPYDKKDVLYFGIFEASNEIEFEGELSEDTMLCKFGVSSDIAMRNGSHEGGKQFPKFRIVHVVEAGSRNDVSVAEKHVKRVVTQMGLRINYGKSKECFMATEEQLRQVLIRADEFVQEEVEEVPDIRLEMRRLDLEGKKMEMAEKKMEMEMAEKKMEKKMEMESRLIGLFSEGKLTYEQMREMLDK